MKPELLQRQCFAIEAACDFAFVKLNAENPLGAFSFSLHESLLTVCCGIVFIIGLFMLDILDTTPMLHHFILHTSQSSAPSQMCSQNIFICGVGWGFGVFECSSVILYTCQDSKNTQKYFCKCSPHIKIFLHQGCMYLYTRPVCIKHTLT